MYMGGDEPRSGANRLIHSWKTRCISELWMQDCALLESLESAPIHPLIGRECDRGLPKRPYNGICQELNPSTGTQRNAHSLKAMTTLVNNGLASLVMYPKSL